jgi:acetylornithine deacetylase/succinyl-diaminopimelate desuccinylase-like protein
MIFFFPISNIHLIPFFVVTTSKVFLYEPIFIPSIIMEELDNESLQNAQEQLAFIKNVINEIGPRIPGTPEERKCAYLIKDDFTKLTGVEAKKQKFTLSSHASIATIPLLGYGLFFATVLYFLSPIASAALILAILGFAVIQIFRYLGWMDHFFPKSFSRNVFAVLDPPEGEAKYTIIISGHMDSSWNWNLAMKNPRRMWLKIPYGIVSGALLLVLALLRIFDKFHILSWWQWYFDFAIIIFLPGYWFLSQFLSWDKSKASPGAMDNLSGISVARQVIKYYKQHPEKWPKGCRFVLMAFGAEEASLKGSQAYVKKYLKILQAQKHYVINPDGVGDWDAFHVIDGDTWLGVKYDEQLCQLAVEAMQDVGAKPANRSKNPVGGSDAASFAKVNIPAVTIIAQTVDATNYYHTVNDTAERLDLRALAKMTEVVKKLIEKIAKLNE